MYLANLCYIVALKKALADVMRARNRGNGAATGDEEEKNKEH